MRSAASAKTPEPRRCHARLPETASTARPCRSMNALPGSTEPIDPARPAGSTDAPGHSVAIGLIDGRHWSGRICSASDERTWRDSTRGTPKPAIAGPISQGIAALLEPRPGPRNGLVYSDIWSHPNRYRCAVFKTFGIRRSTFSDAAAPRTTAPLREKPSRLPDPVASLTGRQGW